MGRPQVPSNEPSMTKTKQRAARGTARKSAATSDPAANSTDKLTSAFPQLRLRSISIRNYKGLDALDLEIPRPRSPHDPDILVVGSKNGAGKTSLLEACALVILASSIGATNLHLPAKFLDYVNYMVRAGETFAVINGVVELGEDQYQVTVTIRSARDPIINFDIPKALAMRTLDTFRNDVLDIEHTLQTLLGFLPDPLLTLPVCYWHSYRRVSPGNLNLRAVMSGEGQRSSFKREVVLALMSKAGLFEGIAVQDADRALDNVNELVQRFASGSIEKLRTSVGNAMDVRISPTGGGPSYSFDGLSSGQKEMISTLFMLWRHTQNRPGLVLIDEPELHLNAEWHAEFVGSLVDIAPQNQYILATHSEDVAAAVSPDRRVIIQPAKS